MAVDGNDLKRVRVSVVEAAKYVMQIGLSASQRLASQAAAPDPPPAKMLQHLKGQVLWLLQAAMRFGFKCHQFAGGFDSEAAALFHNVRRELEALGDAPKPA